MNFHGMKNVFLYFALTFSAVVISCQTAQQQVAISPDEGKKYSIAAEDSSLEASMATFVQALKEKDTVLFLTLVSKTRPFYFVGTISDPPRISRIYYDELAKDLQSETGWYEAFFDAGGDDCFRDYVLMNTGKSWVFLGGGVYVPSKGAEDRLVYVKWRKEDGQQWVIDEIGEPVA